MVFANAILDGLEKRAIATRVLGLKIVCNAWKMTRRRSVRVKGNALVVDVIAMPVIMVNSANARLAIRLTESNAVVEEHANAVLVIA